MTSFIAAGGSGRSTSVIPPVPPAGGPGGCGVVAWVARAHWEMTSRCDASLTPRWCPRGDLLRRAGRRAVSARVWTLGRGGIQPGDHAIFDRGDLGYASCFATVGTTVFDCHVWDCGSDDADRR